MTSSTYSPDTSAIQAEAERLLVEAEALIVNNPEELDVASELLNAIGRLRTNAEAERVTFKEPWLSAGRAVDAAYRDPLITFDKAIATIQRLVKDFRRRADEARLAELKRVREDEEREQQRLLEQAARAEEQGLTETAEALLHEAETIPPTIVRSSFPAKTEGISMRERWAFEIEDVAKVPREYMLVNETAVRRVVDALKGNSNIPGIRVYRDDVVARNGRR